MSENTGIYLIFGITAIMLTLGVIALFKVIKDEVSKEKVNKQK
ncbi:MAG TPA: hypothetical protein VJC37_06630 [Planctomycetota bacterium]|nr:hypothetical protein [Planctomycetota bacterium]